MSGELTREVNQNTICAVPAQRSPGSQKPETTRLAQLHSLTV
jgi:hypothetical protein